jgi:hypothetical protein
MSTVYLRLVILSKSVFHFDKKGLEPNRGRLRKQIYSFLTKLGVKMCLERILSSCYVKKVHLEVVFQVYLASRKKLSYRRRQVKQQKTANKIWIEVKILLFFPLQSVQHHPSLQNSDVAFEIIRLVYRT